jgi:ABC-type phosphate/phosphonate transport system substrate-binding protein
MRHLLVLFALTALVGLTAGCENSVPTETKLITLEMGVNEPYCKKTACKCVHDAAVREYDGLIKLLRETHNIQLNLHYHEDIYQLEDQIKAGKLDGLICKAWWGQYQGQKNGRTFQRQAELQSIEGKSEVYGLFLVLKDSPIKTMADLKGKSIAFGTAGGYEKHFLAFETLKRHGVATPQGAKKLLKSSCQECAVALLDKAVEACVVSDYAFEYECIVDFASPDDFRVIGKTHTSIPLVSVLLDTAKVPATARERVQAALLSISGKTVPKGLYSKGFIRPRTWTPAELKSTREKE